MRPDASRTAYDGSLLRLVVEDWGGRKREIVESPDAVTIVAVDREGRVALVRQLREAARKELLELPAGGIEPGEDPLSSARRELLEETGLRGGRWSAIASFHTTPGFSRELMHLFFAQDVESGEAQPNADEAFELVRVPVGELEALLPEIEDGKTLVGLLLYLRARAGGQRAPAEP